VPSPTRLWSIISSTAVKSVLSSGVHTAAAGPLGMASSCAAVSPA
jgi:hypothetical protein